MTTPGHLFFEPAPGPSFVRARIGKAVLRRRRPQPSGAPDEFYVWLFQQADLPLERYRTTSLSRRLAACLRAVGVKTTEQARAAIEGNPALLRPALNAVLLGVTSFCRDKPVFEAIQRQVLPALFGSCKKLRIWSAACSEGHELYSVAMLAAEAGRLSQCELLGTDCRAEAIEKARSGIVSAEAVADFDPHWLARHFISDGRTCRVTDALRASTQWKVADLFQEIEAGPWDLILWRNMAIYLTAEAAEKTFRRILSQLRPGGYLVTGKADHPPAHRSLRRVGGNVYQWDK